ncbi:MAG: hypothetical protein U1F27_16020 [Turneriella sp.]
MAVNYLATLLLPWPLLPSMHARKNGAIAVISSVAGKLGTPFAVGLFREQVCARRLLRRHCGRKITGKYSGHDGIPGFVNTRVSV